MKTAIFWSVKKEVFVFYEEDSSVSSLGIADYSGTHIECWEEVKKDNPLLHNTEYEDYPRGRLLWNEKEKAYYFYADKKILNNKEIILIILNKINIDFTKEKINFNSDLHYQSKH